MVVCGSKVVIMVSNGTSFEPLRCVAFSRAVTHIALSYASPRRDSLDRGRGTSGRSGSGVVHDFCLFVLLARALTVALSLPLSGERGQGGSDVLYQV